MVAGTPLTAERNAMVIKVVLDQLPVAQAHTPWVSPLCFLETIGNVTSLYAPGFVPISQQQLLHLRRGTQPHQGFLEFWWAEPPIDRDVMVVGDLGLNTVQAKIVYQDQRFVGALQFVSSLITDIPSNGAIDLLRIGEGMPLVSETSPLRMQTDTGDMAHTIPQALLLDLDFAAPGLVWSRHKPTAYALMAADLIVATPATLARVQYLTPERRLLLVHRQGLSYGPADDTSLGQLQASPDPLAVLAHCWAVFWDHWRTAPRSLINIGAAQ
jgi:hypothetical protein